MPKSIQQATKEAVLKCLREHLHEKVSGYKTVREWALVNEYIEAPQCPAVAVTDTGGWDKVYETAQGLNTDGTVGSGQSRRTLPLEIQIWLVGNAQDTLEEDLRKWADGVVAVIEDNWDLDDDHYFARAKAGAPLSPVPFGRGSDLLQAITVSVTVDTWSSCGDATFD